MAGGTAGTPGEIIAGKYEIERPIARGGTGFVVAARHLQLGRRVAIKFLLPEALADTEVRARFEREARAAAGLESDHVARVLDVGQLDSGEPYLVMEFLEGESAQRSADTSCSSRKIRPRRPPPASSARCRSRRFGKVN